MILNFENIETVFRDNNFRQALPEFKSLFDSWLVASRNPALRQLGKRAILDFLEQLDEDHLKIISDYFGEKVVLEKVDSHIVKEVKGYCENIPVVLDEFEHYSNFIITRNKKEVTICFWR